MTTNASRTDPGILRNSVLALPVGVIAGALLDWKLGGWDHSLAALLSSIIVLLNLWILSVLGPRLVHSLAEAQLSPETHDQGKTALWLGALVAKFFLLLCTFFALLQFLPPFGVAMGFLPMLVGTLVTGIQLGMAEAAAEEV